jgi:hypothetical protein
MADGIRAGSSAVRYIARSALNLESTMKGNIAAIVLILTGGYFLGRNLGWFSISLMELVAT